MSNGPQHGQANSEPLITAIIPTYQRPRLLKRAIHSVLNQTYPNLQVCIYDNASGDETEAVVREIAEKDQRVKYFCHPTNIGAARNFEYGLSHVNTPYFSLLSDDDVLLPDFYTKSLQAFEMHPDAGFTIGMTLQMEESGSILSAKVLQFTPGYYHTPEGLLPMLDNWWALWTGILFRREVLEKIGTFDLSMRCIDTDFQLRAAAVCSYVVFHDAVAIFISHQASSTFFFDYDLIWPSWQQIAMKLKQHRNVPQQIREQAANCLSKRLKRVLFAIGLEAIVRGVYDEAEIVASILQKHLDLRIQSRLLRTLTWISKHVKMGHTMLVFLYDTRKALRRRRSKHLQYTFGHYSDYLRIDDEAPRLPEETPELETFEQLHHESKRVSNKAW
jgi:GT2 family glycosyltransferase